MGWRVSSSPEEKRGPQSKRERGGNRDVSPGKKRVGKDPKIREAVRGGKKRLGSSQGRTLNREYDTQIVKWREEAAAHFPEDLLFRQEVKGEVIPLEKRISGSLREKKGGVHQYERGGGGGFFHTLRRGYSRGILLATWNRSRNIRRGKKRNSKKRSRMILSFSSIRKNFGTLEMK